MRYGLILTSVIIISVSLVILRDCINWSKRVSYIEKIDEKSTRRGLVGRRHRRANNPQGTPTPEPQPIPPVRHNEDWLNSQNAGRGYWVDLEQRISDRPFTIEQNPVSRNWIVVINDETVESTDRFQLQCSPLGLFDTIDYLQSGEGIPEGAGKLCPSAFSRYELVSMGTPENFWLDEGKFRYTFLVSRQAGAIVGGYATLSAPDGSLPPNSWAEVAFNALRLLSQASLAEISRTRFAAQTDIRDPRTRSVIQDIIKYYPPNVMSTRPSPAMCDWLRMNGIRWPKRHTTAENSRRAENLAAGQASGSCSPPTSEQKPANVWNLVNVPNQQHRSKLANSSKLANNPRLALSSKQANLSLARNGFKLENSLNLPSSSKLANVSTSASGPNSVGHSKRTWVSRRINLSKRVNPRVPPRPIRQDVRTWRFAPEDPDGNFYALLGTVYGAGAVQMLSKYPPFFATVPDGHTVTKVKKIEYIWLQEYLFSADAERFRPAGETVSDDGGNSGRVGDSASSSSSNYGEAEGHPAGSEGGTEGNSEYGTAQGVAGGSTPGTPPGTPSEDEEGVPGSLGSPPSNLGGIPGSPPGTSPGSHGNTPSGSQPNTPPGSHGNPPPGSQPGTPPGEVSAQDVRDFVNYFNVVPPGSPYTHQQGSSALGPYVSSWVDTHPHDTTESNSGSNSGSSSGGSQEGSGGGSKKLTKKGNILNHATGNHSNDAGGNQPSNSGGNQPPNAGGTQPPHAVGTEPPNAGLVRQGLLQAAIQESMVDLIEGLASYLEESNGRKSTMYRYDLGFTYTDVDYRPRGH